MSLRSKKPESCDRLYRLQYFNLHSIKLLRGTMALSRGTIELSRGTITGITANVRVDGCLLTTPLPNPPLSQPSSSTSSTPTPSQFQPLHNPLPQPLLHQPSSHFQPLCNPIFFSTPFLDRLTILPL